MLRKTLLATTMNLILVGGFGILADVPAALAKDGTAAALPASNPFATESALPFHAPPFDKIKDAHYQPAFEAGMREHLAEVAKIAADKAEPTFANTIEAMERSGAMLSRVALAFNAVTGADTNDTLQKVEVAIAPKLAGHQDAIYLDPKLFARVGKLYDGRDALGLTAEQKTLVERYYENFVRAGAKLGDADKAKLRELNKEESTLTTEFGNKLLAANNAGALVLDKKEELAGFSDADVAAAAAAAKAAKKDGKFLVALQNTTQQPAQVSLTDRSVRERLFKASTTRAEHGDANDTRAIIQRLAVLRAERAKLLGYPNYAAYTLADQMAKKPENAIKLMTDMVPTATAKARGEAAKMQALIDQQKGGFKLAPWDWQFYAEQVRKAEYDLDESQIKPYFEIDRVLKDGVFFAANQMYGLTFKERKDLPVYHPDVRVFEVFDADGKSLALFYADYWKRESKRGGAWMDNLVGQSKLLGTKPVVYNVCNFTKPAAGQPGLITHDDVNTMFHEFGHALHGMFADAQYPTLSGTNVPRDFVEFPSQFNEHWGRDPKVFANYAKHYQTGAPMPAELVEKIRKSATFDQGFATTEYLAAALLDMAWHTQPAGAGKQDVDAFETKALGQYKVDLDVVPPRYRTSYFAHVWGGGYAAGYYAYLWSEVLDHDAFYWFREHGGMTRENGQRFRDMILSRGSTQDMAEMYRAFRGRDPEVEPLLEQRGLKEEKKGG
ncbi:peptidyl-dipeptidase Dcp [Dokdonella sp.]|uniref:peptidyl-dipeptidase Dcp n=1 Tax=Dokdonella sp. TaxID=2291710 RepID=UPI002613C200|nr:peptidyl-dipeptidase Dcp [Dokdonella sp.]